jgi:Domain of unknown function (DUF2017)
MFSRRPIRRTRHGRYAVNLGAEERQLLRILPGQMKTLLTDTDDPGVRRLFPPAYSSPDDQEQADEYRRLMTEDLVERHRDALDVLERTADATELSPAELDGWMRSLNSLRLVLGTQLGVTEDDDVSLRMSSEHALYYFLGYLQECAVEALSGDS